MMEEDLRAALLADAAVSAVVGDRVSWAARPQGAGLPAVVLHLISGQSDYTLAGPVGLREARVQADCWSDEFSGAKAAGRAVLDRLNGFSGTVGGTLFQGVFLILEHDDQDDMRDPGAADRYFRVSYDFKIQHQQRIV